MGSSKNVVTRLSALVALGVSLAGAPSPAAACGGFFCATTPMNQASEDLIFSIEDDGSLIAYVSIGYSGAADAFAWILPLPTLPEISVGTDDLFTVLDGYTQPTFTTRSAFEGRCRPEVDCPAPPWERDVQDASFTVADAAAAPSPGVTIALQDVVGPYDVVVLQGRSAAELRDWLTTNDYQIPESSVPLMEDYASAGYYFVALRLSASRTTSEIQPIVLRYREGAPCIPIRLTAIATVDNLPIRAFFLSESRVTPLNYSSLELTVEDPAIYLAGVGGRNPVYESLLTREVDAMGGKAFVTEYADLTPPIDLSLPSVEAIAQATTPAEALGAVLSSFARTAQLVALLTRYVPPPAADQVQSYYNCLLSAPSAFCGDSPGFDPVGLAAALEAQIVTPRREAMAMVQRHPYLTRLATTMSAFEMTLDPTFRVDPGLPTYSNFHEAVITYECDSNYFVWTAPRRMTFESGNTVRFSPGVAYPGSEEQYCADRRSGAFAPYSAFEILQITAAARAAGEVPEPTRAMEEREGRTSGGGFRCGVSLVGTSADRSSFSTISLASLALLLARRRRPSAPNA